MTKCEWCGTDEAEEERRFCFGCRMNFGSIGNAISLKHWKQRRKREVERERMG